MIRQHKKTVYEALGRDPVHPFPARMAPGIALEIVENQDISLRILDPMVGSGTVIALARSNGHRAVGIDMDPLAILISKVWTSAIDIEKTRTKAVEVLKRARAQFREMAARDAYPAGADPETRRFVRYWFDSYARRQLTCLASTISRVRDSGTRNALWCAFSRLIITKQSGASLAMDLAHSRPHRVFERAPAKPFSRFVPAVNRVLDNCIDKRERGRGPATSVRSGDARKLPIKSNSVDIVLTSPPYLNAIDYMRCSKFALVWMGYGIPELREIRSTIVGTEVGKYNSRDAMEIIAALRLRPKLAARDEAVLARYIHDMYCSLAEVARVLVPGGRAIYVVGENTVRGTYVPNARIVSMAAECAGLTLCGRSSRSLPPNRRYLPPPSMRNRVGGFDARVRRELVLSFAKAGS